MSREAWCPTCDEWTSPVDSGRCLWCDGELDTSRRRRSGRKPGRKPGSGRLTDQQLRVLHLAHVRQQASINQLAKQIHERIGYRSHHSAAVAISAGWKRLGLPARDRIEATRLASTTHGHGARDRDEQAYRRFLAAQRGWRALQGPGQPQCKAVKTQPPGVGQRCQRPAVTGSEFCQSHDPTRAAKREATLARMRARQPREEMLPMAPFVAWLQREATAHGSLRAAALAYGWPGSVYRYAQGEDTAGRPKSEIAVGTVRRWAEQAGTSLEAIYDVALDLAEAA